jgi:FeS assembly SUF system protein
MVTDDDDIERLKVTKIVRREGGKVGLEVYGKRVEQAEQVSEAFGGGVADRELGPLDKGTLHADVVGTLKSIFDPEIPVNVYDLGLIYGIAIDDAANVEIEMTLTAPGCPVAGMIVREVASKVGDLPGVRTSHVKLTWDPPWTKDRMSEEAMLELGLL